MKINIYLESGYLNIPAILKLNKPFTFIVGGRGIGKTYGALKYIVDNRVSFMLMRRTQTQTDLINKPEFSPFKSVADDLTRDIAVSSNSKYSSIVYLDDEPLGYTCALSTISNMRGFDASNVKILVYDEFIPERHERPIKGEGAAFLNAYETINRNRELKGQPPLQCLLLANSFNIANDIFMEMGLVNVAARMQRDGQELYINDQTGVCLIMPNNSRISEAKATTALYKATKDGTFNKMALGNEFAYDPDDNIGTKPLKEYRPVVTVGGITIYKHKSGRDYYVTEQDNGSQNRYNTDSVDLKRFLKKYGIGLYNAYMADRMTFQNMLTKSLFELYII